LIPAESKAGVVDETPAQVRESAGGVVEEKQEDAQEKADEASFDPETYAKLTPVQKKLFDLRLKMVSSGFIHVHAYMRTCIYAYTKHTHTELQHIIYMYI
jgi:hypothetical protein